jgi:hypothetical protein
MILPYAVIDYDRIKKAFFRTMAASDASIFITQYRIAGFGRHGQTLVQTAGRLCRLEAHTGIRMAIADDAGAPAGGDLEKRLGDVIFFSEMIDDRHGFGLGYFPGVVFPAMLQPERTDVSSHGDAGIDVLSRGVHGLFARTVHDHDKIRLLKYDACCIFKRDDFFVFIGCDPQVFIKRENFNCIFTGKDF